MTALTIDLTEATDDALSALFLVAPAEVTQERQRRTLYPTIEAGLEAFNASHVHLAAVLDGYRGTPAVTAIRATGIIEVGRRMMLTMNKHGVIWPTPKEIPVVKAVRRTVEKSK